METTRGAFHETRFQDVAVTVDFHCNSACRFCIVQEGMNRFKGVPFEKFKALVDENRVSRKYGRVIFTGGEVTLEKSLFTFVQYAHDSGAFADIRLQTNARRLADASYTRSLVDAGVNEFFVSIHGHNAAVHDDITQRPGSFDELIGGLENLREAGVRIITNTVMNTRNVGSYPDLVAIAARFGVVRMEFWNYLPMEDQADERDLIAPLSALVPGLRAALTDCKARGIQPVTKYVPYCMLGEHAGTLDNSQPDVIIVESFWNTFPRFNCVYEATCEHSESCLGVHHAYVNKYGWEHDRVSPTPRTRGWAEREEVIEGRPERYDADNAAPAPSLGHPTWEALVEGATSGTAATLVQVLLTRNQARFKYLLAPGASFELVLGARDDSRPALARTRSFNVFYTNVEGPADAVTVRRVLESASERILARDDGQLTLDLRKGLLQVLPPERAKPRQSPARR